jgi:ribulose-5-phosphate 4-epimerase/fuculose-1-phosphate aldolase
MAPQVAEIVKDGIENGAPARGRHGTDQPNSVIMLTDAMSALCLGRRSSGGATMNVQAKETKAPASPAPGIGKLPMPPKFANLADERLHRKQRLAAGFRLFSKFGFDEGVAGHITARDPEFPDTFWVNPFGVHFSQITVSNLIRCDHKGAVVEGDYPVNTAAFVIHSRVHAARPDAVAAAHSHSTYGRAFSTLGRTLAPITQDVCAFYNDHALYDDFGGVVVELDEGQRIAEAIGKKKAAILQNHGLITVGGTVDEAVWWFITMERSCQVQLLAEATLRGNDTLKLISPQAAAQANQITGSAFAGWFQFQPLYARIVKEQPDLLD